MSDALSLDLEACNKNKKNLSKKSLKKWMNLTGTRFTHTPLAHWATLIHLYTAKQCLHRSHFELLYISLPRSIFLSLISLSM